MIKILLPLFAFSFALAGCSSFINMAKTSPPYGWNEQTGKFPDTPENRAYFLRFIEQDLQNETKLSRGEKRLQAKRWEKQFDVYKKSDDNPQFYINYVKQRRRELGLPEI